MGSIGGAKEPEYDVLVIGAGLSGICTLCHLRQRFPSWRVKVIEAGGGAGGTWYWNRYPGARFDSESITYGFSWDKELLDEWHWKESFSPQPETLKYIQRICDKHNLYGDIQFNTRIEAAQWKDADNAWLFTDDEGKQYTTRWFISCLGFLSAPTLPNIPGVETFQGEGFHSSRWPQDFDMARDFGNKRIGIIGTGATGIQIITEVAKEPSIKSLNVFQRTANWSAPLRNTEITPEQMDKYRSEYNTIFNRCAETPLCFLHESDPRKSSDATEEERHALWEKLYAAPGFAKWLSSFSDTYTNREANKLYSDFMEKKIRARIHDPVVADSLIPKTHGFGMRRLPLESGYFEVYNQPNVNLVDLQKTPIERVTPKGILTSDGKEHELDVLIYATGFDAITGAFSPIDWQGKNGRPLLGTSGDEKGKNAAWVDFRPRTYLGLTAPDMPNMFMVLGPHQPFGNVPRSIEHAVQVICEMLQYIKDNGYTHMEPSEEAVEAWTKHVVQDVEGSLLYEVDSWATGVNKNVKGKSVRTVAKYSGSAVEYRRICEESNLSGWKGLNFS